jgi:hypothetical protein
MNTEWKPIESAPQTGRTLLLGYWNSHGKWRTVRGQWMSLEYIAEHWEDPDDAEAGWFETAVEADDAPNCWPVSPSHWQPMPAAPCQTCNGHGAVGNILNAEPCPDCSPAPTSHPIPTGATGEDEQRLSLGVVLGLGEYIIQTTASGEAAQIVFSQASDHDRATRTIGDLKIGEHGPFDHSRIRGQIMFTSAAGLDALEVQLRELRKEHWPETVDAAPAAGDALELLNALIYLVNAHEHPSAIANNARRGVLDLVPPALKRARAAIEAALSTQQHKGDA